MTLTFDVDVWPWHLTLRLIYYYLDDLKKKVTWHKKAKSYVTAQSTFPIGISSRNILKPTRSLYDFLFQSYGSKCDFHGFWCAWPWPWHFKVIWFLHVEILKNSLYFIMGIFRCHWNVRYLFLIDAIFCNVHIIDPSNVCIHFEKNRLTIDDLRKSEKIVCFLWRHVAQKRDVKNEGRLQRRHSIGNVVQPTRSLYDFRLKSYGTLYDFYKSGDLDLDRNPNFTKKLCQGTWTRVHQLYKFQKDRTSIVACRAFKDGQTDRQTDRGDQYTLQKSTILQSKYTLQIWYYLYHR